MPLHKRSTLAKEWLLTFWKLHIARAFLLYLFFFFGHVVRITNSLWAFMSRMCTSQRLLSALLSTHSAVTLLVFRWRLVFHLIGLFVEALIAPAISLKGRDRYLTFSLSVLPLFTCVPLSFWSVALLMCLALPCQSGLMLLAHGSQDWITGYYPCHHMRKCLPWTSAGLPKERCICCHGPVYG